MTSDGFCVIIIMVFYIIKGRDFLENKAKVLINCRKNSLLQEFFVHSDTYFEIMSTSNFWEDITLHISVYKPDVFVIYSDDFSDELLTQVANLKRDARYSYISVIIVTAPDAVAEYDAQKEGLFAAVIKRTASGVIKDRIMSIVRDLQAEKQREEERLAKELEEAKLKEKKNILVIDDDRNVLRLVKTALEQKYNVTCMINGKTAIKYLSSKAVDLILLDYQMPEADGPEVFKQIRSMDNVDSDVPIVFLTGVSDREKIKQVVSLKPQGYLLKPIDMNRLYGTIKDLIENE